MTVSTGFESLVSRRMWLVPDFNVWGLPGWSEVEYLAVEQVGSDLSIHYGRADIGDSAQAVSYADLTDYRGNHLPEAIVSPKVLVQPRGVHAAFLVGAESGSGFKIGRDPEAEGPVAVDLLVIEMGP
jgi:hypothetical protein